MAINLLINSILTSLRKYADVLKKYADLSSTYKCNFLGADNKQ